MTAALIISGFDQVLIPMGFNRKKTTWNREIGSLVEVIDIQIGKGGGVATMNAGVLSRSIYSVCWGRDAEPFIEEPFCTVRARVGQLINNLDVWWDVGSKNALEEMIECLIAQILPFLERMQSLRGMRDWLASTGMPSSKNPLPSICFAVLQSQLGEVGSACEALAELERKALGAWKVRAQEVAMRVGCTR